MDTLQSSLLGADYGESSKKLKLAPPSEKLCIILSLSGDYGVFIVDFNDADAEEEFVEKRPNLRFRGFGSACFCVLEDGKLYIFPGSAVATKPKLTMTARAIDDANSSSTRRGHFARLGVYSFELSRAVSKSSDLVLEKKSMRENKSHKMLGQKLHPDAVRHGRRILVFSTGVMFKFNDEVSDRDCDFEVYDLLMNKCTKLPQLYIRRPCEFEFKFPTTFALFHPDTSHWEEFPVSLDYGDLLSRPYFVINSSSVYEDSMFIVQTEFGQRFCLDLDLPSDKWHWHLFEGVMLSSYSKNPITPNWLVSDSFGAVESCGGRHVNFPISSFDGGDVLPRAGYYSSSIGLLKPRYPPEYSQDYPIHTPCIVQLGSGTDDYPNYLYWLLDLLRLDYMKFPFNFIEEGEDDQMEGDEKNLLDETEHKEFEYEEEHEEFVKRRISFKFCMKEHVFISHVMGLFPFEY